jgi:WD40 repeat protein
LQFLADGKTLITCDQQAGIRQWDVVMRQERPTLQDDQPTLKPNALTRAPDGVILAAGDWNSGLVQLWDQRTRRWGRSLGTPFTEGGWSSNFYGFMGNSSVAFSPDGRTLALSGRTSAMFGRGTVQLLDVSSGQERLTLHGHRAEVWSLAFARDGNTLVSGSEDHTIKFWDPVTGDQRMTLRGHEQRISTVAFSPDGTTLATASWDGTVRLWRAATKQEVDARSVLTLGE